MADGNTFEVIINTPDREFYQGNATMIELATTEGEMGVYPKHIPLTGILVPCSMVIHTDEGNKKAAVMGGIVEILQDKVTVLAEVAEWPDEIDVNRANEAKLRAEERIKSKGPDVDLVRAEAALRRSMARLNTVD